MGQGTIGRGISGKGGVAGLYAGFHYTAVIGDAAIDADYGGVVCAGKADFYGRFAERPVAKANRVDELIVECLAGIK